MPLQYLVFVGAAINLGGSVFYIRDTLRGTTKPNRVTFLMWAVAPLIGTAAALADGVGWAVLPVFMSGFIPLMIFVASFVNPRAYWKLSSFDYVCGLFSLLALILWAITKQPIIAIAFAIVSDGFALLPTLQKSWHYPDTETGIAYVAGLFSALTSFAAVQAWAFSQVAFPIYLVIANTSLVIAIYRRRLIRQSV